MAAPPTPPTTAPTGPPTTAPPTAPATPPVTAPLESASANEDEAQINVAVAAASIHRDIKNLLRFSRSAPTPGVRCVRLSTAERAEGSLQAHIHTQYVCIHAGPRQRPFINLSRCNYR